MENANPALVVASASNPSAVSILAEPASQGLGIANIPGRAWRDLNASPRIVCDSMALIRDDAHACGNSRAGRAKLFQRQAALFIPGGSEAARVQAFRTARALVVSFLGVSIFASSGYSAQKRTSR